MAKLKIDYYEVINTSNLPTLEFRQIADFIKLAENNEVNSVFITHTGENKEWVNNDLDYFIILLNNVFYSIKTNGYETTYDYLDAEEKDFPTAAEYYEAQRLGFLNYKEFDECRKSGIQDRSQYVKVLKLGFAEHFEEFKTQAEKSPKMLPEGFNIAEFDSATKLCKHALDHGFKDYGDFNKAIMQGFADQHTYDQAKAKGFSYAYEYLDAVRKGFDVLREYQEAVHLKINSKHEYNFYTNLKKLTKNVYAFDEANLISALMVYENGKKLSIKKIRELLVEIKEKVKFSSGEKGQKTFPEWYIQKLNTDDNISAFLSKCTELNNYGIYDADAEYFEVSRLSDTKIYLDASNIAHNNQNKNIQQKAFLRNILLVAEELRRRRYKEIIVIADASLRHKLVDNHQFEAVKKIVTYLEAPAKTSADEFLIEKAKADKCYIISNDTFSDWRMEDTWIAQNIDKIRVPFLISDDVVSIPALDRLMNGQ